MPKRIASSIEWKTEQERKDAQEKAEERGFKFPAYVRQHFKQLPRKKT